jgi:hypothetical protein
MKCPHCRIEINEDFSEEYLGRDTQGYWSISKMKCPNPKCTKLIFELACGEEPREVYQQGIIGVKKINYKITVNPLTSSRPPVPSEVEEIFASDYKEACLILTFSPKASAALSRRCLQNILREKAGVKKGNLSSEIQQIIDSNTLPFHLSESIDAIRNIGNFAAHPTKSTATGEIVEVETGEAEWLLDVIEALFDFYFVQPAILKAKKDALNKKLAEAGKPPMK